MGRSSIRMTCSERNFRGMYFMRQFASHLLFAGLCLALAAGCSSEKKKVEQPSGTVPPPPSHKGKPPPTQAEK
jgi:hypothetical protein